MYCKVRNVALLGHGGDGKTSLAESLLYVTKGTDRLGKVTEGNTVSDYDSEEIKRHFSISTSVIPVDYKEHVVNILDTPGYFDFVGEVEEAVKVSGAALILCSAKDGISVGTEKSYKMAVKRQIPRMFCVSKMDEEHANFDKVFSQLRDTFGTSVCPVVIPIMENDKITGVIDLTCEKAYKMDGIKSVEIPIPDFMASKVSAYKEVKRGIKTLKQISENTTSYTAKTGDNNQTVTLIQEKILIYSQRKQHVYLPETE